MSSRWQLRPQRVKEAAVCVRKKAWIGFWMKSMTEPTTGWVAVDYLE